MMRVFFDSSVLISAIISETGGSRKLAELAKGNKLAGIISQGILEEVLGKATKIGAKETEIIDFIGTSRLLIKKKIRADEVEKYADLLEDPNDAHVIAAAKSTKCQYLATLDKKHLLRPDTRKKFRPLRIVSPKELLVRLLWGT